MQERILKLADLSEFERNYMIKKAQDESDSSVSMKGEDAVIVRDETESDVDSGSPRDGVDASQVPLSDEVAKILEEPFKANESEVEESDDDQQEKPAAQAKPFEPDPADVRNFIRCMLGNKRFTKEYEAYGGNLRFTLGARTHAQDEDIVFGCANMNQVRALAHMTNMRLAYSLIDLRVGDDVRQFTNITPGMQVPVGVSSDQSDLADAAQVATQTMLATEKRVSELCDYSQAVYGVLSSSMRDFDMLVTVLTQRANDPKHWLTDSAG